MHARAITVRDLRRFYLPVYPGVYAPRDVELSAVQRARAAWLWSRRRGVLAGLSAAALLGSKWIGPESPAEIIHSNPRAPSLLTVYGDGVLQSETQLVGQVRVTTPARTAFDIGRRSPLAEGVQRIDALINATWLEATHVDAVIACHPGERGLGQVRQTLKLVDGRAESPYESLTRLVLVRAGFPAPECQIVVADRVGKLVGRLDLGWRKFQVAAEFDGAQHWTDPRQRNRDVARRARLEDLGWIVIRLTSGMLHNRPEEFLGRVGAALLARGCAKTW